MCIASGLACWPLMRGLIFPLVFLRFYGYSLPLGSFAWARDVSPCCYARLCRAGFLPIAESFKHAGREIMQMHFSSIPGLES